MKRYTTEVLLEKLQQKAVELGRTPKKEEIDADKTMPNSDTYFVRFGGLTNAFKVLNLPANRVQEISLEYFIKLAKEFYKRNNRSPGVKDFDCIPGLPHSSYIRKELEMTWNKFLMTAGLPIMENGDNWVKNYKAEKFVESLLIEVGIPYVFQSVLNMNAPYSFVLGNGINLDVRFSSPVLSRGSYFWKFKTHLKSKKEIPDYFVCIGYDNLGEPDTIFLIPTSFLADGQEVISVNMKRVGVSKYGKFIVSDLQTLRSEREKDEK